MKKIIALNFIVISFLICFMVGGVYATDANAPANTFAVPEPSSILMLSSGLIGVFAVARKFKKK